MLTVVAQVAPCISRLCWAILTDTAHHGAGAVDQETQVHSLLPGAKLCRRLLSLRRHARPTAAGAVFD